MKICAKCLGRPVWHYAANTSRSRGSDFFILTACPHVATSTGEIVAKDARAEVEKRVDARIDEVFTEHTARWSESARAAYHAKLYPPNSGEPWENFEWVKAARIRLANKVELFDRPTPENDCPFD